MRWRNIRAIAEEEASEWFRVSNSWKGRSDQWSIVHEIGKSCSLFSSQVLLLLFVQFVLDCVDPNLFLTIHKNAGLFFFNFFPIVTFRMNSFHFITSQNSFSSIIRLVSHTSSWNTTWEEHKSYYSWRIILFQPVQFKLARGVGVGQ